MKRLHSFVLKSYIGPFFLTMFITLFLLLMQFLWKYIDDLIGKGLEFTVISELLFYAVLTLVPMALPLAVLLSSIMTFGNLGESNELMAIKSSGVSLIKIMSPLIYFMVAVCIGAFFFSNNVLPYANLKMGSLLYDVRQQRPEISIKEGVFTDFIEGYSIKVGHKNKKNSMLYNIMIYNHSEKEGNREVTLADSGLIKTTSDGRYLVLTMYSGITYNDIVEKKKRRTERERPHRTDKFAQQRVLIDMSGLGFERTDESLFRNNCQMLNLQQLDYTVDSLGKLLNKRQFNFQTNLKQSNYFKRVYTKEKDSVWYTKSVVPDKVLPLDSLFNSFTEGRQIRIMDQAMNNARTTKSLIGSTASELDNKVKWLKRHEIEWHRKFTLSLACLLLFFIGAPLGAIIRKGGFGMPVVISVLFFIIYYVISMSTEKSAKIGVWPAWLGMWFSSIVFFPLGMFLTYKAANDSVLINMDTYFKAIKKIFNINNKFILFKRLIYKNKPLP